VSRVFEQGYSMLFSRSYTTVGIAAAAATFTIVLLAFRSYLPVYVVTLGLLTLLAFLSGVRIFTIRRSLILASIALLITSLVDLAVLLMTGRERPLVGLGSAAGIFSAPLIFLRRNSNKVRLIAVLLGLPLYLLLTAWTMGFHWLFNIGVASLCISMIALVYPFSAFNDGLNLFAGFTTSLLMRDPEPLEEELAKIGEEREVTVEVIKFKARDRVGVLLIPNIHSGPFDNIGGGSFVARVFERVGELNIPLLYLHGVGSHELDPVSSREVEKVVEKIVEVVRREPTTWSSSAYIPKEVVGSRVKVVAFGMGDVRILMVSRLLKSSDDIPTWVAELAAGGRNDVILVDSQNKWGEDTTWDWEEVEELRSFVEDFVRSDDKCNDVKLGVFHEVQPSGFSPRELGVGGLGALVMECCSKRFALVVLDGNNIEPDLYERLLEKIRGLGYDVVEVATTDTHQLTGFGRGRGYDVIGESTPSHIVEDAVVNAVRRAEENMARAFFNHERIHARIQVVGERGFYAVKELSRRGVEKAGKVVTSIVLVPIIASLLLNLMA